MNKGLGGLLVLGLLILGQVQDLGTYASDPIGSIEPDTLPTKH